MPGQVDIAVDLGAVPTPLPEICFFEDFVANEPKGAADNIQRHSRK